MVSVCLGGSRIQVEALRSWVSRLQGIERRALGFQAKVAQTICVFEVGYGWRGVEALCRPPVFGAFRLYVLALGSKVEGLAFGSVCLISVDSSAL